MKKEIDYMEYISDGTAQAAYVTNAGGYTANILTGGTPTADAFNPTYPVANACDGSTATIWDSGATAFPHWWMYQFASAKVITKVRMIKTPYATFGMKDYIIQGSNNGSSFTNLASGTFADSTAWQDVTFTNSTPYLYYRVYASTGYDAGGECIVSEFEMMETILQSYSEATIKTQGSYALKAVAAITDSATKTLTRTVSPAIDLSGVNTVKFDIYASRTGANIKIGIHDSGGTTSEKTYTVLAANTWETVTWDISAVSDANKNVIDSIIVTIANADAANTVYFDNFIAELYRQMVFISD